MSHVKWWNCKLGPVFVPKNITEGDVRREEEKKRKEKTQTRMCMDDYSHNFWTISLTHSTKIFVSGILFSHSMSISVTRGWFAFSATLFLNLLSSQDPRRNGERERG